MVKPALPYLDVVHAVKVAHPEVPLAAYNVSGEYAMLKAAALQGWIDERRAVLEALTSIARAGADLTITYYAKEVARWLDDARDDALSGAVRRGPDAAAGRRCLARPRVPCCRRHAALHRLRQGLVGLGRRR